MDSIGIGELNSKTYFGSQVGEIISQLGELRISVFHDFPYLYDGDLEYEKNYLKVYTKDPRSIVHVVFDNERAIGATTGMPLSLESDEIKEPFQALDFDLDNIYYFGESILLNDYRGRGLGHQFFDIREKQALKYGFEITAFCSVVRPEDHPLKPANYRPNDVFWKKRGYTKQDFSCKMSWLDRNEIEETAKELQFWMKTWK